MFRSIPATVRSSLLGLALAPTFAAAVPLAPGGVVTFEDGDTPLQVPAGTKLAERTIPFTLQFPVPAGVVSVPPPSTTGSLTNAVYRNGDTGKLFFVYDVDVADEDEYTDEISRLTVGSFAGFATDVSGDYRSSSIFPVRRSADGSTLVTERNEGLGSPPLLVVQTDATTYNELGTGQYFADAEFDLPLPDGSGDSQTKDLWTAVNFTGLYQPAAVPEPTAGTLALAGAALLRRRKRR
jgi:hypothetical protein